MKNILIILALLITSIGYSQYKEVDMTSKWEQNSTELTLNSQLLGQSAAQGLLYGAGGYALGYWLSDGKTGWGIVGSLLMVNIPILLEKNYDKPEIWIGRNAGAALIGAGLTIHIHFKRKNNTSWSLHPIYR